MHNINTRNGFRAGEMDWTSAILYPNYYRLIPSIQLLSFSHFLCPRSQVGEIRLSIIFHTGNVALFQSLMQLSKHSSSTFETRFTDESPSEKQSQTDPKISYDLILILNQHTSLTPFKN